MRRAWLVTVALVALLAAGQSGSAKTRGVLAMVGLGSKVRLGYVDPATLKLVGKSTRVGSFDGAASRSPDGSQLALAQGSPAGIRVVDLRRLRTVRSFRLSDGVSSLAWVGPRRILVVSEGLPVFAVDPVTGRRLWNRNLATFPEAVARSAGGLVFLSPPADDYQNVAGPSTLTTVSSAGVVRSVVLDRIVTGSREPDAANPQGTQRFAGLTVDAAGNRAFVVGAGEPVAEVDLATLAVTYHGGTRTLAKLLDGPYRTATWLPNGTIAVAGYDGHVTKAGESETPAGLEIVDTRDWSARMVDPNVTSVAVAGDRIVAYSWFTDAGLAVYGQDGALRVHALQGPISQVQLAGGTAFVSVPDGASWKVAVVDLATGRLVSSVPRANILLVP